MVFRLPDAVQTEPGKPVGTFLNVEAAVHRAQPRLLVGLRKVVGAVHVGRGNVDDPADLRAPCRRDDTLEERRRFLLKTKASRRGPALSAVEDNIDRADRVGERLLVGVGVQLDDRHLCRQRSRDVIAKKFPGADDQKHAPAIKARSFRAAAPKACGQGDPDVLNHLGDAAAQRPPRRGVRLNRRPDGDVDAAERTQDVGASNRDRADGNSGLQGEVSNPDFERPQALAARVAALREDQHDAASLEYLVDRAQPCLVELAALR